MSDHLPARLSSGFTRIKSTRVRALLSIGMVFGLGAVGTLAYWTDSATLAGGTFTAGKLDIKLGTPAVDNNPPQFTTDFAMTNLQPGGPAKAAVVTVRNTGSVDFVYSVSGLATNTGAGVLASVLNFKVVPGGALNVGATDCTGTSTFNNTMATTQTVVPFSPPVTPTAPRINAAATDTFCVVASLPSSVTTGQTDSATAAFTFTAKQVGAP